MSNFSFRNKKVGLGGVVSFDITRKGKVRNYVWPAAYSPVYRCFTANEDGIDYNLRPSCYGCKFHEPERFGDLTIGDAWGIQDKRPELFDQHTKKKGISLIFENTRKGALLIEKIQHLITNVQIPLSDALSQPALLPTDKPIPAGRKILYDNLDTADYQTLVESVLHVDFDKLQTGYIRRQKINRIKQIIKKIIYYKMKRFYHIWKNSFKWCFTNMCLSNFPSKHFRNWGLRVQGMKLGDARIYDGFHIRQPEGITIENGVSIGPKVLLDGRKGLIIKRNAVIGYGAIIWTLNHDYNDLHFCLKGAPVEIGEYCWICSHSIILPGIKVGKGAVVASGAIVTKDVPPYAVVAGIPARIVKYREEKDYQYGYHISDDDSHFC